MIICDFFFLAVPHKKKNGRCRTVKRKRRMALQSREIYTIIIIINLIIVKLFGVCPVIFPFKEKGFSTQIFVLVKRKRRTALQSHETYTRIIVINLIIVKLFGVCPVIFPFKEKGFSTQIFVFVCVIAILDY